MSESIHSGHRSRMRLRFLKQGAAAFEPHQLVEMLLFYGIPRKDTNVLAHELMNMYSNFTNLLSASHDELMQVPGMTQNAAALITLCGAIHLECEKEQYTTARILDTTKKMGNFVLPFFKGCRNERVLLVCMDNTGKVLTDGILTEGSVNSTEINMRKVLAQALRCNATRVLLAHNHPNGHALASQADRNTTRAIINALTPADILLVDHIIVAGNGDFMSMKDSAMYTSIFAAQKAGRQG